jgi:hypothetical protein
VANDVSREEFKRLLDAFLSGTQVVDLRTPVEDLKDLPLWFRTHLEGAQKLGKIWTAWVVSDGHMVAWGEHDQVQSRRIRAHVLYIEWCLPPAQHHASWWYCYATRPLEWICGRGDNRPTFHA